MHHSSARHAGATVIATASGDDEAYLNSIGADWALKHGDTFGLLAGIQVLAMLGIRYPLKMIPLLLFELVWKAVWLVTIALPLWRANSCPRWSTRYPF